MALSPSVGDGSARDHERFTIAGLLAQFPTPELNRELDKFRINFEARFGETDLTKRYTSTWPQDQQEWLLANHPRRYWLGLPPFVQAFMKEKMRMAQRAGKLDDMPESFLALYLNGNMDISGDRPTR